MEASAPEALYIELLPLARHRPLASHLFVMRDRGRFTAPGRSLFATQLRELVVTSADPDGTRWRLAERAPRFGHEPRRRPFYGWMVGVRSPGWAAALVPADGGPAMAHLLARLPVTVASSAPFVDTFRAVDALLDQVLETSPARRTPPAVGAIAATAPPSSVTALALAAGLSPRTVQRQVSARLGLSPKRWLLVGRFERALRRVALGDDRLAEIAVDAGYADQAHLTAEMKRHTGMTPGRLRGAALHEVPPAAVRFLQDDDLHRRLQLVLSPDREDTRDDDVRTEGSRVPGAREAELRPSGGDGDAGHPHRRAPAR